MLNRRNLRIKIMQSLFALELCKEANYQLGLASIKRYFEPDLNSMEVQDKDKLAVQRKTALTIFEEAFEQKKSSVTHEDNAIEQSVNLAFESYQKQCKRDSDFFRKNLVSESEKIYNHYIAVLTLGKAFADLARSDKKVKHTNFIENAWIEALRSSEALQQEARRVNQSWDGEQDKVRLWFRDVIRQDSEYLAYLDKKDPSHEEQKKFAMHLFRKLILGKNSITDYFEEKVLRWAEDKDIVKGMVEKTVKSFDPAAQTTLTLHTLSLNWEDDLDFIERLYDEASNLEETYVRLIADNTRNWEVERLPLTDRIILEMAIAELLYFASIPVKVTINEYIELAKVYSTPKSRQFINGILDVIAKELKTMGVLKKSGRGLLDNK